MTLPKFRKALPPLSLLGSAALAPLLFVACAGTETDNPYHSAIRFEPDAPGEARCVPNSDDVPPSHLPLWGRSGNYLVGIDVVGSVPRRGLVVLDVSDPAAPRVVAEQPLAGYPRQLLVEGNSAALVIDEFALFDAQPIPEPAALEAQTKLVRFDLSTPSAPRRVAEALLEGEFWQLQAGADGYWVMSGHVDPATQRCDAVPDLTRNSSSRSCGYVTRDAMIFTHHTWSGSDWVAAERLELPAGQRAWLTEAGVATSISATDGSGKLSFAAFADDGSLEPVHTLPLPEPVVSGSPLHFDSERVGLFSYDLSDGRAAFSMYTLTGNELGRVHGLSQELGAGTHFVPGGVLVASGHPGEQGSYIDIRDPSTLRAVTLPPATAFLPLSSPASAATRALGWQTDKVGNATTFSLWGLGSAGATLLDTLPTSLKGPQEPSDLKLTDDEVVFSLSNADYAPLMGTLRWDNDTLALAGPIAGGFGDQHLTVGDWLYEPDARGLAFGNPSQGSAQRQAWDDGTALDVSAVPAGEARLLLDSSRGAQLSVTRGGVTQSIPVSPGAQRLLPAGERLIVLSTEGLDECRQTGLDCSNYAPNVAIVELDPLRIVSQLPLPELPVPELSAPSRVEQRWRNSADATPVRLGAHSWLLENQYSALCYTEADCLALGIQSEPLGRGNVPVPLQAGCGPGVTACPQPPTPTVGGEAQRRLFYVLDAAAASLSDALVVEGERGTPYQLWARPVFSHDTLLDLHLEPSAYPKYDSPPPTSSAFLLERYVLNAAGGLDALPVINIPGYPVALLDEADLLTLEPGRGLAGTAQLHRLKLNGTTASISASRALPARAGKVTVVGQTALYVRNAPDVCEPVTQLQTFALDATLTPRASLDLPGDGWNVVGSDPDSVVLERERAFVKVEIDAQGNLHLSSFQTTPSLVGNVQVDQGTVRAISADQVVRLPL